MKRLTIVIKNKAVLSRALYTEKGSNSGSQTIQIKTQSLCRGAGEVTQWRECTVTLEELIHSWGWRRKSMEHSPVRR